MTINGLLKAKGQKTNPKDVATKIVAEVPDNELIEKLEVAGPGFVNIYLNKAFIENSLMKILEKGVLPPNVGAKKKVVLDFSSPNIAKEMHVGHLRKEKFEIISLNLLLTKFYFQTFFYILYSGIR